MNAAIFSGHLRHRRFAPIQHAFDYPLFMVWLNTRKLDATLGHSAICAYRSPAIARFHRKDYLGPHDISVDEAVRQRVQQETGTRPAGPIFMLTHLRYFGHCFNPVTFYYCYDAEAHSVSTIVTEITNTPWAERHAYVLAKPASGKLNFSFAKAFHVSPFNPMDQNYRWRFNQPRRRVAVHMQVYKQHELTFDATLACKRRPWSHAALLVILLRFPAHTLAILVAIYWQAFRLARKHAPFHPHPRSATAIGVKA